MLAAGLTTWLALEAGPMAARPVAILGACAAVGLVATLVIGRTEPIPAIILLLGCAYAVILVADGPPLDGRSAVVASALLAVGELAHLSVAARDAVTEEADAVAGRIASVAVLGLLALAVGGAVLAVADLIRTRGLGIEVVGVGAAIAAVGLLAHTAREASGHESAQPDP